MALPRVEVEISADTSRAEAGLDRVERGMRDVGGAADVANARTQVMGREIARVGGRSSGFSRGIQNASFQLGDFATQVGAGTSASIALGQQLPQLLGGFGVLGAVMGAVVAIGVPLTRVLSGMSEQGRDLSSVLGVLQPAFQSMAAAFGVVRDAGIAMAEVILNNFDRILITAGGVAAFFAGRWVVSFVAARVATFSLTAALAGLRAMLIRIGIGALVIAAGELVYMMTRLSQAAGGFGNALGLIGGVFSEVWGRMRQGISLMGEMFEGLAMVIQGAFQTAFGFIQDKFNQMINAIIDGINAVSTALPAWMGGGQDAIDRLPDESGLSEAGAYSLSAGRGVMSSAAGSMSDLFTEPLESVQTIRDLLASMRDENLSLSDILAGTGSGSEGEGGGGDAQQSAWDAMLENINNQREALSGLREASRNTWSAMGDFLQQFAGKSKAAAIAVIAVQKGLAIAQIITSTAAAQMRALAELGPIAGPPMAARIGLMGKIQAGLVAATGLAQAAGAGGGGGGASAGGGVSTAQQSGGQQAPRAQSEITLVGEFFSPEQVGRLLNEYAAQGGRVDGDLIVRTA